MNTTTTRQTSEAFLITDNFHGIMRIALPQNHTEPMSEYTPNGHETLEVSLWMSVSRDKFNSVGWSYEWSAKPKPWSLPATSAICYPLFLTWYMANWKYQVGEEEHTFFLSSAIHYFAENAAGIRQVSACCILNFLVQRRIILPFLLSLHFLWSLTFTLPSPPCRLWRCSLL